jgi:hypothetical protein
MKIREKNTNYPKRLGLLKSGKKILFFFSTNTAVYAQLIQMGKNDKTEKAWTTQDKTKNTKSKVFIEPFRKEIREYLKINNTPFIFNFRNKPKKGSNALFFLQTVQKHLNIK